VKINYGAIVTCFASVAVITVRYCAVWEDKYIIDTVFGLHFTVDR